MSWYWRLHAESAASELALLEGDPAGSMRYASNLLDHALATRDRSWHSRAYLRVAAAARALGISRLEWQSALRASASIRGLNAPLVRWRVHAYLASLAARQGRIRRAEAFAEKAQQCVVLLTESLHPHDPLRDSVSRALSSSLSRHGEYEHLTIPG
jgi:hypothetical protein